MIHEEMMRVALQLAKTAEGQTSPNPLVGAVCVKDGQIIGTGVHMQAGTPHAEVHALEMAGDQAVSADLYITLEPCAHKGRTPPCTTKIIKSGISRVIIATEDPNPQVSGKGIEVLKKAGIEVVSGILQQEAQYLNRAFFHFIQHGTPYITLKAATTLDGRLASTTGNSKWITSETSRSDVHSLRHTHDAILVGVGTVLQDNPFLTTRLPHGGKNPIRIILDRQLRTPKNAHIVTDGAAETILFTQLERKNTGLFEAHPNLTVENIAPDQPFLATVLKVLAARGIMTLLVEGGSRIHSSFIDANLADELYLYIAPKLLGNGASLLESNAIQQIKNSHRLQFLDAKLIGEDIRIHAQFVKDDLSCLQEL